MMILYYQMIIGARIHSRTKINMNTMFNYYSRSMKITFFLNSLETCEGKT